jgi:hypothetical protein
VADSGQEKDYDERSHEKEAMKAGNDIFDEYFDFLKKNKIEPAKKGKSGAEYREQYDFRVWK